MKQLPDIVYVVDGQYEATAIREARRLEIPIIAIVDSNTDPTLVDYPIPANDDSLRTIQLITETLTTAIIAARGGQSFEVEEKTGAEAERVAIEAASEGEEAAAAPDAAAAASDEQAAVETKEVAPAVEDDKDAEELKEKGKKA